MITVGAAQKVYETASSLETKDCLVSEDYHKHKLLKNRVKVISQVRSYLS